MTRVILIRHGQSTFNALGLYQGSSDAAVLTEKGLQTAYQTGKALQQDGIAAVYSSPLQRTQQTAQTLVKSWTHALPIMTHDQLREIDLPNWQGLSYSHVREQDPIAYRCWRDRPHEFQIESAQETAAGNLLTKVETATYPVLDLYRRAQEFWQAVLPKHPKDTIAIVSHGGTIRALISTALGIAPSAFHQMQQSNCGISILDFPPDCPAQLVALNLTQQVGELLPKLKEGKRGLRLLLLPTEPSCTINAESWVETCAQVPINFCLSQKSSMTQPLKDQLDRLQSRSVVHLQVDTQNFLPVWNQMITRSVCPLDQVCTGLVVATTSEIQGLLHCIVGAVRPNSLRVDPGKLAVVYYPTSTTHPILQAMNWAIAG